jgi:hypothetical protein
MVAAGMELVVITLVFRTPRWRQHPVPAKTNRRKQEPKVAVVNFAVGDRTYQIDPERQKVYQRFVEIESARASAIFSVWRAQNLRP